MQLWCSSMRGGKTFLRMLGSLFSPQRSTAFLDFWAAWKSHVDGREVLLFWSSFTIMRDMGCESMTTPHTFKRRWENVTSSLVVAACLFVCLIPKQHLVIEMTRPMYLWRQLKGARSKRNGGVWIFVCTSSLSNYLLMQCMTIYLWMN